MTAKHSSAFSITVVFTPEGFTLDFPAQEDEASVRWQEDYRKDRFAFLYHLGFESIPADSAPAFRYLSQTASRFASELMAVPALEITREQTEVPLTDPVCQSLLQALPFGLGTEYVDAAWLRMVFGKLQAVFNREIAAFEGTVALYFAEKTENLRLPERVFFHLVENRKDADFPFAFLATYTTRDRENRVRHMPLSYALEEYRGKKETLVGMLACLNDAAEAVPMVADLMSSGELFHPLRLTSGEAYTFLQAVPDLEKAGIACRLPDWWRRRSSRVSLSVQIGEKETSLAGLDSILRLKPSLCVDGVPLSDADIRTMLRQSDGLAFIKGKWVEVDHAKLEKLLKAMEDCEGDISLMQALRMQGGLDTSAPGGVEAPEISNGRWLSDFLTSLRRPEENTAPDIPLSVHATLRPYQVNGFAWLSRMLSLNLGACLADDMGLGKTLQVLTLLEALRQRQGDAKVLLVVPASLLGNWEREIRQFVPDLPFCRLHGATAPKLEKILADTDTFLYLTTYGIAARLQGLRSRTWDLLILDEAQAIKNPGTRQTRAVKELSARGRIAMTGTPIENDLSNLWSLFDFLNTGLLGTAKEFDRFSRELAAAPEGYMRLRRMVSPFILRRLKTDKNVISDLPEKIDVTDCITLSKRQVVLYRQELQEIEQKLPQLDGMERRGVVLAAISKFKQICNHPDQYLGLEEYAPEESGKFEYLREICETIRDRHERVLIFTQYREITPALDNFLSGVFGRRGLVLHGGTPVRTRPKLVEAFNGDEYVPYMVLTLKAGGTGLNLTKANHVVLFDRWWNPAVENQAMDRAFRIGQKKNVFVHRFVAGGTIEEKIDEMIRLKQQLADDVVGSGSEKWITELSDQELLKLMKLEV